jgi:pimeloyl-ACP methyl ester carboxylesterase
MDPNRERRLLQQFDAPPEGHFVEINGMEMYYEIHGRGDPLLLLHGFTSTSHGLRPFLPIFLDHFQIIVPDLRGHGRSNNPSGEFTHRQAARDAAALLDHLGIDRFKAAGQSTGGMTLLHLATQQPTRPEALILMAATSYFPEAAREIMRRMNPDEMDEETERAMREFHMRGGDQILMLRRQFQGLKDSYEDMNFTGPLLSTIRARTLIIHGDRDSFFEIGIPVEMYRAIPNSYLWILPNSGHIAPPHAAVTDPETLGRNAIPFLRGEWE